MAVSGGGFWGLVTIKGGSFSGWLGREGYG